MTAAPLVLGVSGSPRRSGNSDVMLRAMLEGAAGQGARTRTVHLRDYAFSSCIGCERCRKDKACTGLQDGMTLLYPLIEEARGVVLASPSHCYNVSALMKAYIDRHYCYFDFTDDRPRGWSSRLAGQGRLALLAGVCEQVDDDAMGFTIEAMRMPFAALGYEIVDEVGAYGIFDRGRVQQEEQIMQKAAAMGADLARRLVAG